MAKKKRKVDDTAELRRLTAGKNGAKTAGQILRGGRWRGKALTGTQRSFLQSRSAKKQ